MLERAMKKSAGPARKDRRLRAVYRRELQNSVYYWALVASAGTAAAVPLGVLMAPGNGLLIAAALTPMVAAGLFVAGQVRGRRRQYVIPCGMFVGLIPILATVVLAVLIPPVSLGTLGLVPLAFAVFIPLERKPHLLWLCLGNTVFGLIVVGRLVAGVELAGILPLLFAAAVATACSLAANDVQLRRRRQMDDQLMAVRGLCGRMKEHELDLRRQDEFLLMQQETLVVQQAELLRLNEELETIARLDALTGLGNRLRLNEDLAQLAARIQRNGGRAGLLLMDLDRFKRLNDSAGHLAGDTALRGVADVLRKTSRVGDGVYRYGGEEFLVLLHDCDEQTLAAAGQRFIGAIEAAGMVHPDNPPYGVVTASAGVSELSKANCTDVDGALHDADEALYVAKASGRNRLETHGRSAPADLLTMERKRVAS